MSLQRSGTARQGVGTQPPTPPLAHHATHPSHPLPQCHGTKTLRQRPGYLRTRDFGIVDDSRDSYLCFYCGPSTKVRQCARSKTQWEGWCMMVLLLRLLHVLADGAAHNVFTRCCRALPTSCCNPLHSCCNLLCCCRPRCCRAV